MNNEEIKKQIKDYEKEIAFLKGQRDACRRRIEQLEQQRDYYKERYLEFNNAFIQGGRKLTEE